VRLPNPSGVIPDNGNGSYGSFNPLFTCNPTSTFPFADPPWCYALTSAVWNFDWSINVNKAGTCNKKLDNYCYELGMDADPSAATDFTVFDPINPTAGIPFADHAFGDNTSTELTRFKVPTNCTPPSDPAEAVKGLFLPACYKGALSAYNVAQNSWNYEFFNNPGTSLSNFDPTVPGSYIVYIRVIDCSVKSVVAETFIEVLVGTFPSAGNNVCLPKYGRGGSSSSSSKD
jgi:hypothetical protein